MVNIHAAEIPAPPARIFSELSAPELLLPRWHWRFLFGVRAAAGKILGWDRAVERHRAEPLEPGMHYAFFLIEHVDPPHEAGMSVENRLTKAQMSWLLEATPGGTRVYNVTCANFHGAQGRLYWHVIRPFHDGLIEDSLRALCRRVTRH